MLAVEISNSILRARVYWKQFLDLENKSTIKIQRTFDKFSPFSIN